MAITQPGNLWQGTSSRKCAPDLRRDISVDLVIIGGGFTGCAAALEAARMGASVAVLEAREIGHGGSGRNVGLVNAGLWLPPEKVLNALGREPGHRLNMALASAPDLVFSLIEKHGISCEATRGGTLHLAHAASGMADLVNRYRQLVNNGSAVDLLSREEVAKRTGSTAFRGAIFNPTAGTIQPLAYVQGLADAATKAGAQLYERSPAQRVARKNGGWQVETSQGSVQAKALLRATNAYAPGPFVPVSFFQVATKPLPKTLRETILPGGEGCWDTGRVMSSFRMDQAGRLILGAVGDLHLPGADTHRAWARRKLAKVFPAAAKTEFEFAWDGRIAMTGDHIPKIVSDGLNALQILGYSGRGIGPGTVFGTGAAQALLGGDPSALPVAPIESHTEKFTRTRHAIYEAGATLTHFLDGRI